MPTIQDVARAAGVSTSTVSRALSGSRRVAPDLVARVAAVARELDYRPHSLARNLRQRASGVWGLVISDVENAFFTSIVRGIEDGARAAGYSVILCSSDGDLAKEAEHIELMIAERVAGVAIATASSEECQVRPLLERGIPVVAVDREIVRGDVDTVVADNAGGAAAATRHLVQGGATRIGCITGPRAVSTAVERLEGYRSAIVEAGLPYDRRLVRFADFKQRGGHDAALELLDVAEAIDALFVTNNLMTAGALQALSDRGVGVPGRLPLVSFDETYWTALVQPRLTTVAQPTFEMGTVAAQLLAERIAGGAGPGRRRVLGTRLVVRDSSRPRDRAGALSSPRSEA
jgi:LacI family transcriptional regulator